MRPESGHDGVASGEAPPGELGPGDVALDAEHLRPGLLGGPGGGAAGGGLGAEVEYLGVGGGEELPGVPPGVGVPGVPEEGLRSTGPPIPL